MEDPMLVTKGLWFKSLLLDLYLIIQKAQLSNSRTIMALLSKLFHLRGVNSLPNKKILDWSKLKAFADNIMNLNEKLKLVLGRIENIVEKGENAGYQHFLLSHNIFKSFLLQSC